MESSCEYGDAIAGSGATELVNEEHFVFSLR
jgi:hypothetical protein